MRPRIEFVGDAQEMAADHREESVGEGLMDALRRFARRVGRRERHWALLVDAAERDDAGHEDERQDRQQGQRHQAAERVVSEVAGAVTGQEASQIGADRRWRDGKA